MPVLLETLDAKIAATLAEWNGYTSLLALAIAALLAYPLLYPAEPDTHPLLLARQAAAAPVRNRGESAVYRNPEIPPGYPLKAGLNVKALGAPRWQTGKNGDLRDVWREVVRGGGSGSGGGDGKAGKDGEAGKPRGLLLSVYGKEAVEEHKLEQLSTEINVLGSYLREKGGRRVAIYLPNSVEYLLAIFACSFYGLTPVLLPFNLPHPKLLELVNATLADSLICAAGTLPLDQLAEECQSLRLLTWVVEKTSRHMDWSGVPDSAQDRLKVSVWHDLVQENPKAASALPENSESDKLADLVAVWQPNDPSANPTITTFTQANLVSATSALLTSLPLRQRLNPGDLLLPANSFNDTYTLCWIFAALYAHASLALTSVAGPGVELQLATRAVAPTIIVSSPETLAQLHARETASITSGVQKFGMFTQSQALNAGRMPTDNLLFKLLAPSTSSAADKPGTLRLILTNERLGADSPPLSSTMLSDLRIFTKARIIYALTSANVAGAISQTHVFDYRRQDGVAHSRFGAPLASVEVKLLGPEQDVSQSEPEGELVVLGPAVVGGEWRSGRRCRLESDGCLAYA